ncbi:FAD-dependent oxidoreductase [bacterium]|nr:FAD-dependent oxidoreductase [bacterium]
MELGFTRRQFATGALAVTAGTAAVVAGGTRVATAAEKASGSAADASATGDYAARVATTMDCDIVVVGAGMSGLAAAVEALNDGASVIVLESEEQPGGNGTVTSCVMGVGSKMQQSLGIDIKPAQIITAEMQTFNYAADGVRWANLIAASSDNIDWIQEQGATLCGVVDKYQGVGSFETAHEWTENDGRDGGTCYVQPMAARVADLGGTLLTSTPARQIIMRDGTAAGVYAESADGVVQVNAKAVILATGGYANNDDLLASRGYDVSQTAVFGIPGHNGDGITMALAAGAKSWLDDSSLMEYPMNPAIGRESSAFSRLPTSVFVNGNGARIGDENASGAVPARAALMVRSQDISYALFNQDVIDAALEGKDDARKTFEDGVSSGAIIKADTVEGLAQEAGIDAAALVATMERYNADAKAGEDTLFGKDASALVPMEDGPFYLSQNNGIYFLVTIGGIDTTETCEVRAEDGGVIPGLYAVGVDGVENYRGCYTIDVPGSCNANNIHTGRVAAQRAVATL